MEQLIEYLNAFAQITQRTLEDMFDVSSSALTPAVATQSIKTSKNLFVSVNGTGTTYVEYILALDEATAAKIVGLELPDSEQPCVELRDEICDALSETLNTIAGEAILRVQENYPKLTLAAPRVFFGEIRYPQFQSANCILSTDVGELECHFCHDLMRLSIADSFAAAQDSLKFANQMLIETNQQLRNEVDEHVQTQVERDACQRKLVQASRLSGMSEVASEVLHNVGNVLNSVNVSASLAMQQLHTSRVSTLTKLVELLSDQRDRLPEFIATDKRGKAIPKMLELLDASLGEERSFQKNELNSIMTNIDDIKNIIDRQLDNVQRMNVIEPVNLASVAEEALRYNQNELVQNNVAVVQRFDSNVEVATDRYKLLNSLTHMIRCANESMGDQVDGEKKLVLAIAALEESVEISVADNGRGFSDAQIASIFSTGVESMSDDFSSSLHASAITAKQLGGSLSASSDGPGKGCMYTFQIPVQCMEQLAATS